MDIIKEIKVNAMSTISEILPYRLPRIKNRRLQDPHVVIVGAGASIAACRLDKNGMKVPLLKNIHNILGLTDELNKYNFSNEEMQDFELLYSNIYNKDMYASLPRYLEKSVRDYFKKLTIPDEPTMYDYLILSLTDKDAIISFNWDPFLMQAYRRNLNVGNLPMLIFPHGNVGMGICEKCHTMGYADTLCTECYNEYQDMPLLFPIGKKDYHKHDIIKYQWKLAKEYLSRAAGITVYGYGVPDTDREAYDLIKEAYSESNIKDIAPFTIINLLSEKQTQMDKWKELLDDKMVDFAEKFEDTILWSNPRVSLEHLFDAILQQHPRTQEKSYKMFNTLTELQQFILTIDDFDLYFE